jgi:hypothetical protein
MDAAGNVVLDWTNDVPRQGNFADRKYFTAHREHSNVGLYVSEPYESRLRGGTPSIALTLAPGRLVCRHSADRD